MQLRAEKSATNDNQCNIKVLVPPTRSDVLHACDVMEVLILMDTLFNGGILSPISYLDYRLPQSVLLPFRMLQLRMGTITFQKESLLL